jgi:hypothetical protein
MRLYSTISWGDTTYQRYYDTIYLDIDFVVRKRFSGEFRKFMDKVGLNRNCMYGELVSSYGEQKDKRQDTTR